MLDMTIGGGVHFDAVCRIQVHNAMLDMTIGGGVHFDGPHRNDVAFGAGMLQTGER